MREIKQHPWFMRNYPKELLEGERTRYIRNKPTQTIQEIVQIVEEARRPAPIPQSSLKSPMESADSDDSDAEVDLQDVEGSGDFLELDIYEEHVHANNVGVPVM